MRVERDFSPVIAKRLAVVDEAVLEQALTDAEKHEAWMRAETKKGLADLEAGRVVSHEDVKKWVRSWGTKQELPRPKCK